jgi:hypothetical protein
MPCVRALIWFADGHVERAERCTPDLKRMLCNVDGNTSLVELLRARGDAEETIEARGSKQGGMLMLWTARGMYDDADVLSSRCR